MTEQEEDLQATFRRLEIQQEQDEGKGLCGLQDRLFCENWDKPKLVLICPTLKKYGLLVESQSGLSKKV